MRMPGHMQAHLSAVVHKRSEQERLQGMVHLVHCAHVLALVLSSSRTRRMAKTTARRRRVGLLGRLTRRACARPAAEQSGSGVHQVLSWPSTPQHLNFQHGMVGFDRAFSAQLSELTCFPHTGTRRWGDVGHAMETPTTTTRARGANGRCVSTEQPKSSLSESFGGTSAMAAPMASLWHGTFAVTAPRCQ